MHWLRKRLGLKLFAACWLLVLLVPQWRQDAREQWENETLSIDDPIRDSTSEKTALLASRFPDDWAVQLEHLSAQYSYRSSDSLAKNAARQVSFFDDYARLSNRFPRENEIRKAWLRDGTRGSLDIDLESAYAHLPPEKRPKKQENWLSKGEIEAAIAAAREGARIEPQNSFFPWMESALHFALKRPRDALAALERASKCSYFDDGTMQTVRRRLELLSRVQNVSWSDKSRVMWNLLFPHLGKMKAIAHAAMKISSQAHQRGEKVRALHIAATVARAGATLSDSKGYLITVMIGDAIQQTAWRGALKNAERDVEEPRFPGGQSLLENEERVAIYQAHREEVARKLAIYARELDQEPIAEQALATLPHLKGMRLAYTNRALDGMFQRVERLAKAFWLEAHLLHLVFAGALLWLVAWVFTFQRAFPVPLKRTMAVWAAFCVGATAVLLGVALLYSSFTPNATFSDSAPPASSYAREYVNNLNGFLVLLWGFPVFVAALLNAAKGHTLKLPRLTLENHGFSARHRVGTLIYGAMCGSVVLFSLVASLASPGSSDWDRIAIALLFVFGASLLAAGVLHAATTSGDQRIAAILIWAVPWLLLAAMVSSSFDEPALVVLILAIALIFLGLSAHLANRRPVPATLRFFFDVMGRARVLAATLAVASAIFYLGVKIVALPEEGRMNTLIDTWLKIGEVAWLDERVKR